MADTGFDELRDLASAAGDKVSLAMGMAGRLPALIVHARFREASRVGFRTRRPARVDWRPGVDSLGCFTVRSPPSFECAEVDRSLCGWRNG